MYTIFKQGLTRGEKNHKVARGEKNPKNFYTIFKQGSKSGEKNMYAK